MKDFAIYLDLDGVLADYSTGLEQMGFTVDRSFKTDLNRHGTEHPLKRQMFEAVKGTEFYRGLPLMPGAVDLYRACLDADPIILTAAPTFGATEEDYFLNPHWLGAAYHKRVWVENRLLPAVETADDHYPIYCGIPDERFICTTGKRKHEFMRRKHSDHQILIDDRMDNILPWAEHGGVGILHVDAATSIRALTEYQNHNIELFSEWGDFGGWVFDPRVNSNGNP